MPKVTNILRVLYLKLFRINDTAQRIALGFGVGVFLGLLPLTGPLAALFLASLLRINRAAALLGSLLTNTWLSIVTFFLSIKIGSSIMKVDYKQVYREWDIYKTQGNWLDLFKLSSFKLLFPVILGYIVVGLVLGFVAYILSLLAIKILRYEKNKTGINLPK